MYKVERKDDLLVFVCGYCGFRVVVKDKLEALGKAMIESHLKSVHKQ
jgi:DNA-directed RNA polymerase subunit RPC12/RpoP